MHLNFRPQFTLRLLLLMTAIIGIALGVWRWPWYEDVVLSRPQWESVSGPHSRAMAKRFARFRVQFHRGWRGEKLKHGPADSFGEDGRLARRQHWRDDVLHGTETWFNSLGQPILQQTWRDGELNGPYRFGDGQTWTCNGHHAAGRLHYERRDEEVWASGEKIVCISWWREEDLPLRGDELQHGPCRWETRSGEVLQTAKYEAGWLTHFNEQPVVDYLHAWATSGKIDNQRIATSLLTDQIRERHTGPFFDFNSYHTKLDDTPHFLVRDPTLRREPNPFKRWEHRGPMSRDLLTACTPWGLATDWRYEELWIVPAEDIGLWRDRTGVAELDVSSQPKLAAIWNKPFRRAMYYRFDEADEDYKPLQDLCLRWPREETGTDIDLATHFPAWHEKIYVKYSSYSLGPDDGKSPDVLFPTFKSWLGSKLYELGLQCELRGNKIVILPHWSQLAGKAAAQ